MARKSKTIEVDGDDLLPTPGSAVSKPKPRKRPRVTAAEDDEGEDAGVGGNDGDVPEMEGLPQHNRRSLELEAQMASRLNSAPVFPYPHELREELKPYWLELVNSFPFDHFQVSDVTLMKVYVQCAYDIDRQNLMIEEEGEIVLGGRGNAIPNPRCRVRESNRNTLMTLATKFRNQPASRVNSENFGKRAGKAASAGAAARTATEDEDDLLAKPATRH